MARKETPQWDWTVLDPELGSWVDAPYDALLDADVVVTHAGQNALAEVGSSRTPAVIVPQPRPHHEQEVTAEVLARWLACRGRRRMAASGLGERLEHADLLDGEDWASWCDGHAGRAHRRGGPVGGAGGRDGGAVTSAGAWLAHRDVDRLALAGVSTDWQLYDETSSGCRISTARRSARWQRSSSAEAQATARLPDASWVTSVLTGNQVRTDARVPQAAGAGSPETGVPCAEWKRPPDLRLLSA